MAALQALFVLFVGSLIPFANSECTENSVRLVGGSGDYEGNVQVCYKNKWGAVCDNYWDNNEAAVVCKQLGFTSSGAQYRAYSYYGYGTVTNVLDYVQCGGSESKLTDCSSSYGLGVTYCGKSEMAGVYCPSGSCTNGDIRLANNYVSSYGRSEGRVEVCTGSYWHTICANPYYTWGYSDARVACRQLGFDSSTLNYYYWGGGKYGYSSLTPAFSYMGCSGSENSLFSCSKTSTSYCYSHYYDAGVQCYSVGTSCTNGDVRLFSAFDGTPDNEGILQVCSGSTWYSVCQYYYSCYVAKTACKQLGYEGAVALRYNGGFYYGYTQYNDYYRYYCYSSSYTSLSQCYKYYYYYCGSYNDAMGLVCYSGGSGNECTNGDVRLQNGTTADEGRVEYCYDKTWSPVCSLSSRAATLMCEKLGYTKFTWGKVISDERFGRSGNQTTFNYLYCSSSAVQLSDCTEYNNKGGGCYISAYACSVEYSLRCYNPGDCTDGDVRLQDGVIEQEGRPEVCINGVWSTICQWSWSSIDGFVFCNMLGYDGPNPLIYYYSYFGSGYGPVAYSYLYCQGWEKDIHDCSKSVYPSFSCSSSYIAGVLCKQGCTNGDVRLVGGGFENEGTVEVCFDNLWGLISDAGWNEADARVVCRKLGHEEGIFKPILGSQYGKPNKTIHLKDVSCFGDEADLSECTTTKLYITAGKKILNITKVAGVDCIYDEPTPPPCIKNPTVDPSDACTTEGEFRLINSGKSNKDSGRVEYCTGQFWTPLCSMDGITASVACRQLEHTQYYYGAVIETGEFGTLLNYSLVQNITCTGSESSISQCTVNGPVDSCLPWCPNGNIGLKCYDPGKCTEGSIRLADGIIEQEGRVEVCVNGVWGSFCDDGWDSTDAHVVCQQLGYPEQEPVIFTGSYFGGGQYPIVYSGLQCGGWESTVDQCKKISYNDFTCSRQNVAGVLCGYDCKDGDVRLVGGDYKYEGIVEVCFDNLWGLIEEVGWGVPDAQVVCRQLGYEVAGTVAQFTKQTTVPDKTVHSSDLQCTGDEENIDECTQTTYSLKVGKTKRATAGLKVAGVTCHTPDRCVDPPVGGTDCVNGDLRLSGDNAVNGAGVLEYCYKGLWSGFCSLGERESTVACRQLGYVDYETVSIFKDGRFDSSVSNTSLFMNFSCGTENAQLRLSECDIIDSCQSTCSYPIGISCSVNANCEEGDVRLRDGSIKQEGRVEVCHNNIWGSVCGEGFDFTDAYVVCKELDLGVSEPVVYTNSFFGDGNVPVVYSNMGCRGYENTVLECSRDEFGSFSCARNNIAGVTCQDNCETGAVRLVGGSNDMEGTLEICYYNLWGVVAVTDWDDEDTAVACVNLGYYRNNGVTYTDSRFGKPNVTVHLSSVNCDGTESNLTSCDSALIPPDEGKGLLARVDVVGIKCTTEEIISEANTQSRQTFGLQAGLVVIGVLFVMSILIIVSLAVYVLFLRRAGHGTLGKDTRVTMSGLQDNRSSGVTNPAAQFHDEEEEKDMQYILEKGMVNNLPSHQ